MSGKAPSAEEELHEVHVYYDNTAGWAVGDKRGWPTIECSCGFRAQESTWAEAGALFDRHQDEIDALFDAIDRQEGA